MSLGLVLIVVVVGISMVLAVTHALGGSRLPPFNEDDARATFEAEFPGLGPERVQVDEAGDTALLWLADGRVGVVARLGAHLAVRLIDSSKLEPLGDDRVRIHFDDVGWPARDITLIPTPGADRA